MSNFVLFLFLLSVTPSCFVFHFFTLFHSFTLSLFFLHCSLFVSHPRLSFFLSFFSILDSCPGHVSRSSQWDTTPNAGFTTGSPWMRANEEDAREGWNATDESSTNPKQTESVLAFYKRAIQIRKAHDVLVRFSSPPRAPLRDERERMKRD